MNNAREKNNDLKLDNIDKTNVSYEKSSRVVNNVHVTTVVILTRKRRGSKNTCMRIELQNLKNILVESQNKNMTLTVESQKK